MRLNAMTILAGLALIAYIGHQLFIGFIQPVLDPVPPYILKLTIITLTPVLILNLAQRISR